MPVGTSGCMYVVAFLGGGGDSRGCEVGLSTHWVRGEEGGFKKLREVGGPLSYPCAWLSSHDVRF